MQALVNGFTKVNHFSADPWCAVQLVESPAPSSNTGHGRFGKRTKYKVLYLSHWHRVHADNGNFYIYDCRAARMVRVYLVKDCFDAAIQKEDGK